MTWAVNSFSRAWRRFRMSILHTTGDSPHSIPDHSRSAVRREQPPPFRTPRRTIFQSTPLRQANGSHPPWPESALMIDDRTDWLSPYLCALFTHFVRDSLPGVRANEKTGELGPPGIEEA